MIKDHKHRMIIGILAITMLWCLYGINNNYYPISMNIASNGLDSGAARDMKHYLPASESITRYRAVVRYVTAMYEEDGGYFHSDVHASPLDGTDMLYPCIIDVDDGYFVLKTLNATHLLNWTPTITFLRSLVNGPSSPVEIRGLVNFSKVHGYPDIGTESIAVDLFAEFGILEELDLDRIAAFIAQNQLPSGGFGDTYLESDNPVGDLIETYFAVRFLAKYGYLYLIDIDRVVNFVLSCQNADGGFGKRAGCDSIFGVLPLPLMTLSLIDRLNVLDEDLVLQYLLGQWDNTTGCHISGEIVSTERAVWCFSLLDKIEIIDVQATVDWILDCQSKRYGGFTVDPLSAREPYPGERVWFCRNAVHTLSMLDRLDALNETITVKDVPVWQVPDNYPDGTTTTGGIPSPVGWNFDGVLYALSAVSLPVSLIAMCSLPAVYWKLSERYQRRERRLKKKEKRPGKANWR